jgi:DNA-binding GntR family transcriptional regulator
MPFYEQLRDILAAEIDEGLWRPGQLLPSESALTSTYRISRTVIRQALDLLSGQGRIMRIKGKGTLVVMPFRWETSPELSGPYDALANTYQIRSVLENRLVGDHGDSRNRLNLDPSVPILHVVVNSERTDRLGVTATLSTFDVAADASPALAQRTQEGMTPEFQLGRAPIPVQLVTQFGLELSHSPTTVSAVNCSEEEAALLGVPPAIAAFCFEWVSYDAHGRAVITGRSLIGDNPRLRFVVSHHATSKRPPSH